MSSTSPTVVPYTAETEHYGIEPSAYLPGLFRIRAKATNAPLMVTIDEAAAKSALGALEAARAAGQASREQQWIPVSEQPKDGSIVTVGHTAGWIEPDILFRQGKFYKRVNHLTGGDAGFKQKDWKKPDGNPAGPDEWPYGPELFPTHYQPLPQPPQNR